MTSDPFYLPGCRDNKKSALGSIFKKNVERPQVYVVQQFGLESAGRCAGYNPILDTSQAPCYFVDRFENPSVGEEGILAYRMEEAQMPKVADYIHGFVPEVYINKANTYEFTSWGVHREKIIPTSSMEKLKEIEPNLNVFFYNYEMLRGLLRIPLQQLERKDWEIERYKDFMSVTTDFLKRTGHMGQFIDFLRVVSKESGLYTAYLNEMGGKE
jgi:hypothetical protein